MSECLGCGAPEPCMCTCAAVRADRAGRAELAEAQTFVKEHKAACIYMDLWEQAGGDAPHRTVRLLDRMDVQRKAAEAKRDQLQELLQEAIRSLTNDPEHEQDDVADRISAALKGTP